MAAETRFTCSRLFILDEIVVDGAHVPHWEGRFVRGIRVFADR